jgi:ribonuclease R
VQAASQLVAVLSRKGRFLVAEPFFPEAEGPHRDAGRWRSRQIVVGTVRSRASTRAAAGELVLLRWSARGGSRSARPQVARVIGRPDLAADVIEALMLDRGLQRGFDEEVEREARGARLGAAELAGAPAEPAPTRAVDGTRRLDLRELPTFTVDPVTARDFDDAISAQPAGDGAARVWVHIADVSAYVRPGSHLDKEAWRRGTSVYVPGTVEPMLPERLSGELCSLVPGQDRLAVSVEMEIEHGRTARVAFHRSLIRSDGRLDYDQVDRIFTGSERAREPWGEGLQTARAAAAGLEQARRRRRGLELDSLEPEFSFDDAGRVSVRMAGWSSEMGEGLRELRDERGAGGAEHETATLEVSESRRMIEHLMIAANEAVARQLADTGTPCLYRVHERPEPQRAERLVAQLASLDVPTPPVPERMSASQAAELVVEISLYLGRHFRESAERPKTSPKAAGVRSPDGGRIALTGLLLRALQQADYSPRNIGHAGLGSSAYCHFTSPIRRYPDLVCHRALLSTLGAAESAPRAAGLSQLGAWCSERERGAMSIERDANDVARCFALEDVLYERGWQQPQTGEVTGVIAAGAFVAFGGDAELGVLPPFEGMVPVRRLRTPPGEQAGGGEREWWELSEEGTILRATPSGRSVRLGDPLSVRVVRVERARGRVELAPAQSSERNPEGG